MKKMLLVLTLVSALPIAPLQAEWHDYLPSVPFWNSTVSEDKENVALTEKELLIQSAKKYAGIGAGLLALYAVLSNASIRNYLEESFDKGLVTSYNTLCTVTGNQSHQAYDVYGNFILYYMSVEFISTLLSIMQLSKVAGLTTVGKAGYDLIKAPFAQSDNTQEAITS